MEGEEKGQLNQPLFPGFEPPDELPDRPESIGRAEVSYARVKDILRKTSGFLSGYDYTLNPYSGCSYACGYCYAASFVGSTELRDSWGLWVRVKENAVSLMEGARSSLNNALIYMSSVTDPYQPVERRLGITRSLLEIMADGHTPRLVVQTRSPDVVRDIELFKQIESNGGSVRVNMTVTTDDEDVRRSFEPSCPSNARRLEAITRVQQAGISSAITMTPLLMVSDPDGFADSLLATGVQNFIVQQFHFSQGGFVATTRAGAIEMAMKKLGCSQQDFHRRYSEHYEAARRVLAHRLPSLGEGKEGFGPPF